MNKRFYWAALCCVLMAFTGCEKGDSPAGLRDNLLTHQGFKNTGKNRIVG